MSSFLWNFAAHSNGFYPDDISLVKRIQYSAEVMCSVWLHITLSFLVNEFEWVWYNLCHNCFWYILCILLHNHLPNDG